MTEPESDPLEELKTIAVGNSLAARAAAAWEKERLELGDRRRHELNYEALEREYSSLRAAVERIEGQARRAYDQSIQTYGATYAQDELRIFADALRAAREPNRPQEDSDGESA